MRFEAWSTAEGDEVTVVPAEEATALSGERPLGAAPTLLYEIQAESWEEAMAVHHVRMGWEPYKPLGKAKACPRGCGALYYPDGSGWCRNCGRVV